MYNISSTEWTWVSGSNTINTAGVYGSKGVPSVNNYPGGRWLQSMVYHQPTDCLYVFQGQGLATTATIGLFEHGQQRMIFSNRVFERSLDVQY